MPETPQTSLDDWLAERWAVVCARAEAAGVTVSTTAAPAWQKALLASDFARDVLGRQPQLLAAAEPFAADAAEPVGRRVQAAVAGAASEDAFMQAVRRARHREAVRLVFRAVNGQDDLATTMQATSALYVALVQAALAHARQTLQARHGVARNEHGQEQQLVVIGMGKLGAGELNFSSDIDLILAYAEGGVSDGPRPLENGEYFTRLGRKLVHLLTQPGANGIVARVDLRLRPFGSAGPLAMSFAAMEQYYQREGREWERYAWIKAAPIAGDLAAGAQLLELLRPFVYRRYLDYGAFAGLRHLKGLIAEQVARKDLAEDIKHGPGGIREVEFCVQLLQMIRGGREPELRVRGLLPALAVCAGCGLMDAATAAGLDAAYRFLRALENALQMLADQQTHEVPEDRFTRLRLARALGRASWAEVAGALQRHRALVEQTFAELLLPGQEVAGDSGPAREAALWRAAREDTLATCELVEAGFADGERARRALLSVARAAPVRLMSNRSRQRLDRLMPYLIQAALDTPAAVACLERLGLLVQAVARRSAYLALLEEQPEARRRLAELFAASAFLAARVTAQPVLLDDVLDPRIEQLPLQRSSIAREVAHALDSLDERHPETDLERLNEVRASLAFRLGLAFHTGQASATATARRLAGLAEAVVAQVLGLARSELVQRHGVLPGGPGDGFAVIAYGSLGGMELGFASDLDLVFVYDQVQATASSDGARPLDGLRWYQRLAQRVVHWLTTLLPGGRLYEVDTRLRPDGSKGMLVTSLDSFVDYQRQRAWIWEHQALVRARAVAGDAGLSDAFQRARARVLARPREAAEVFAQASAMRERWRRQLDRSNATEVDIKQGRGGLLDLEFLLQALVLAHASQHPDLLANGNTAWLLEATARAGLLDAATARALADAHAALLQAALRCTLDQRPRVAARSASLQASLDAVAAGVASHGLDPDPPSAGLP